MKRREFIALVGGSAVAWPLDALAQQRAVPLVGILGPQAGPSPYGDAVIAGLLELGYVDGRNIRIETRWANGRFDELPRLAAELVRLNVDVLVASLTEASLQAQKATARIPVVVAGVGDPVAVRLVATLARPGGNVTGTSGLTIDISGKQLELLKEIIPNASRIAVLWNPANAAFQALQLRQLEQAAASLGLRTQLLEARTASEIDAAFAAVARGTPALVILGDPLFVLESSRIAKLGLHSGLATVSNSRIVADAGVLLTYGSNLVESHRRAAFYVDRILKGASPADLPVEQPTKFELVVNLRTARALGVVVPPTLLARADRVIE